MMRSMPVPRPTARPNPRARGAAHDICPETPKHLVAAFTHEQRNYPNCPKLRTPGTVEGFVVSAPRDYFKQSLTLKNQRAIDVYRYKKRVGLEYRFWCEFHKDFYASVILRKDAAPIVPMKYIDWKYFEDMNDPYVNNVIAKCREFGIIEIMAFRYNWNTEITCQFYCSYYYKVSDNTIHCTTEG
jgi:hypothetical protein